MTARLGNFAVAAGAVMVAGAAVAATMTPADARPAAALGVGLASVSGVVALWWKRRAVAAGADLNTALKAVGKTFGLRAVLVVVGLAWTVHARWSSLAYVLGFFGVYLALQWVELAYVLAAAKRPPGSGTNR